MPHFTPYLVGVRMSFLLVFRVGIARHLDDPLRLGGVERSDDDWIPISLANRLKIGVVQDLSYRR
jgi:hypothetical protein